MRRNPAISVGLLIAVALATAWAFSTMLGKRFASGDVYPPGSTRNAEPPGAKALYDALDRMPGISCERNYKRLVKLSDPIGDADAALGAVSRRGQTLVLLSVLPSSLEDGDDLDGDALLSFAAAGGRVVVALAGQKDEVDKVMEAAEKRRQELKEKRRKEADEKEAREKTGKDDKDKTKDGDAKTTPAKSDDKDNDKKKDEEEEARDLPFKPAKSLREAFHIAIGKDKLQKMPDDGYTLETPEGISVLNGHLPPWFSAITLDLNPPPEDEKKDGIEKMKDIVREVPETKPHEPAKAKPALEAKVEWKVLATIEKHPVLVERRLSHGSIVIATDSRFASNQDLLLQPATGFLAWLIGEARHVIFDETHLGTQENPGIMTLARRFRLHGFFLGGVLLFALFVWQSSSSLVPPNDSMDSPTRTVAGQGAVAGLVSLLRRGIPRTRLLHTCFEQWERGHLRPNAALQSRIEKARTLLPPEEVKRLPRGTLVRLYQHLCETLHPRRN